MRSMYEMGDAPKLLHLRRHHGSQRKLLSLHELRLNKRMLITPIHPNENGGAEISLLHFRCIDIWYGGTALERAFTTLIVADADHLVDPGDENLSISNLACSRAGGDCLDCAFGKLIRYNQFQFRFRQKIH